MQGKIAIKTVLFWVLSTVTFVAEAQLILEGRVMTPNNVPVGFVTIGIKGTTRSVMSNDQGYFTVAVPSVPQVLVCSAIGFEGKEVVAGSGQLIILLQPISYTIKDVTIVGDGAYQIFKKAYQKIQKPGYRNYAGKVFYRLVTQNDSVYTELMEGFYDASIAPTGFAQWKLKHGRYALAEDYKRQHYVMSIDFSGLVRYMDITNDHRSDIQFPLFPFRSEAKARYRFSFKGITHVNNKEVTRVYFEPKSPTEDAFSGTAFIDEQTGKLHRLEAVYTNPLSPLIKDEMGKRLQTPVELTYVIDFTEAPSGEMLLSWVDVDLKYTNKHAIVSRAIHTHIQCFVYDKGAPAQQHPQQRNKRLGESDYVAIRSRLYIKPFWQEHAVLTQTSLEKDITEAFEKRGSFGQAYNAQADTGMVIKEGYAVLGPKVNRLIAAISEDSIPGGTPNCMNLTWNGRHKGAVCSHLFAAYNCYKDSFYVSVLPLLDTSLTWISDSVKQEAYFSFMFNLYARLTAIHAVQLTKKMRGVAKPCENEEEIQRLVRKANEDLYIEQYELLNDLWKEDQFRFWDKYIEQAEKEN